MTAHAADRVAPCSERTRMTDTVFSALSAIVAPAVLTNASAVLQNGATLRYNLAITQWREFRASHAAGDGQLRALFDDPGEALPLAERRVRLQLTGLGFVNAAAALFAATTVGGLAGAVLAQAGHVRPAAVVGGMVLAGTTALGLLLAATALFFRESACGRALLRLHRTARPSPGTPPGSVRRRHRAPDRLAARTPS